ncbi:HlyD family secretion protein [Tuwongella immobilis]|uniref:RND efflux pump membrane fusion protein barrel-sandwich domain-containing protein n=1 Tax=Tuwongella immobilis TaxID=692036 RepID=A0A6C2YXC2_9BACT|nr:HlyD family efflux transporter periplasmic adaptor subunit [Tuwongella immobilis]VIP05445.1 Multidrug resistance efflux pump OS=Singulisphaera acidiphila (strain ATCC BAA-1392 / DSM 18658 / VKM B-2454 / MOB10) GN=Sinac_2086 PE=4 SV=1: HlyD [Tuwongella immobilis]VTS08246.1 Multidrug resistance efflux pump OS=Singulisphaera acidiphila (strain ATCC BAA-1392 / DSM 18658 / VKM B-2454 / MOB10) GN=Sinac_2086 PE=4 SV=1: HlyD [Tuwongella immobilis]
MRRMLPILVVLGAITLVVSMMAAGNGLQTRANDPTPPTPPQQRNTRANSGSEGAGVVAYGNVDVEAGQIPLFPPTFPQPSYIRRISDKAVEGAQVKKDDVLVELDDTLARLKVQEAEAGLKQAQGKLSQVQAEADRATTTQAALKRQQEKAVEAKRRELASARIRYDQLRDLQAKNFANRFEVTAAEEGIKALEAALDVETLKLEQVINAKIDFSAGMMQAEGAVDQYKAQLEQAKYGLSLMTIKAPSDGTILRSLVTDGLQFGPQSKQPAFLFLPKSPLIVRVDIDQDFAHRIQIGQQAVLFDDTQSNVRWKGKVTRIGTSFLPRRTSVMLPDPLQLSEGRVLECIVTVEEGGSGNPKLRVGQKLRVSIAGNQ